MIEGDEVPRAIAAATLGMTADLTADGGDSGGRAWTALGRSGPTHALRRQHDTARDKREASQELWVGRCGTESVLRVESRPATAPSARAR